MVIVNRLTISVGGLIWKLELFRWSYNLLGRKYSWKVIREMTTILIQSKALSYKIRQLVNDLIIQWQLPLNTRLLEKQS